MENILFIQNHDVYNLICQLNLTSKECIEVHRKDIPSLSLNRGFYVNIEGDFVGVYASLNGPIFFHNSLHYLLTKNDFSATINTISNSLESFTLMQKGKLLLEMEYPKPMGIGINPYADESFVDFFKWLKESLEDPAFYSWYHNL